MSNVIGTNCFNTLVIAAADLGYRQGSIYQTCAASTRVGLGCDIDDRDLLLGMVRRETHGIGNIGF